MGRGRAKAKQTKVARELKYHTFDTDFTALQRELAGGEDPLDGEERDEPDDGPYLGRVYGRDEDEPASGRR